VPLSHVDGFVAGPSGEMDWIFRGFEPALRQWEVETLWHAGLYAMGARTFADMRAWWPTSTEVYAAPMNQIPKVVFTHSGVESAATTVSLENAREMLLRRRGFAAVHAGRYHGVSVGRRRADPPTRRAHLSDRRPAWLRPRRDAKMHSAREGEP
jgi:hypothetical protein